MKDYFISYTGADKKEATWIAEILENNNFSVVIQAWDFRPGDNLVSNIDRALSGCKKLIVVLSGNYFQSAWCEAEWTSKYAEQIKIRERCIIPIKVKPVSLTGLMANLIYIDLVDLGEREAENAILTGISDSVPRTSNGFPSSYSLEHETIDIDYTVTDSKIIYRKQCFSRVMNPRKNKIHNRITWFPDETISLSSLTDGITIEPLDLRDTNFNYNVVFDHELKRDEKVSFCVQAVLSNEKNHFKNFFSSQIIVPIEYLTIHLTILEPAIHTVYTQKISNSPMNVRTTEPESHPFISPFHWTIKNPELNFEYKIFW